MTGMEIAIVTVTWAGVVITFLAMAYASYLQRPEPKPLPPLPVPTATRTEYRYRDLHPHYQDLRDAFRRYVRENSPLHHARDHGCHDHCRDDSRPEEREMSLKITFPHNACNSEYVVISAELSDMTAPYFRDSAYDPSYLRVIAETKALTVEEASVLRDQLNEKIDAAKKARYRNSREAKRREIVAEINTAEQKEMDAREAAKLARARLKAFDEGRGD